MGKWTERRKLAKCADSVWVSVRQSKSLFVVLCSPAVHHLRSGPTGAARRPAATRPTPARTRPVLPRLGRDLPTRLGAVRLGVPRRPPALTLPPDSQRRQPAPVNVHLPRLRHDTVLVRHPVRAEGPARLLRGELHGAGPTRAGPGLALRPRRRLSVARCRARSPVLAADPLRSGRVPPRV